MVSSSSMDFNTFGRRAREIHRVLSFPIRKIFVGLEGHDPGI
jgi:hypothetical protein